MKTGRVTAKFVGKTSMGFKTGKTYRLQLIWRTIRKRIGGSIFGHWETMRCLCAYDLDSSAWCPYSSYEAFETYWKTLEHSDSESSFSFVRPNVENARMKIRVKNQYSLHVRSGPGVEYKVIRTINKRDGWLFCTAIHTCVSERSDQSGVWCYITNSLDVDGDPVTGWVCMSYVDVSNLEG